MTPAQSEPLKHEPPLLQLERSERLRDLSLRDWFDIFKRAVTESLDDAVPMLASALAYSSFFAIPATLLLALGLFTLVSDAETIRDFMDRLESFMPAEATQLLGDSLTRLEEQPSAGILLTVVGFVLALWASTSAMTTYMAALNTAHDQKDERSFVRKRLVALLLVVVMGGAVRAGRLSPDSRPLCTAGGRQPARRRERALLAVVGRSVAAAPGRPAGGVRRPALRRPRRRAPELAVRAPRCDRRRARLGGRLVRCSPSTRASSSRTTRPGARSRR